MRQLTTENIKCNVCGLIFLKSPKIATTLRAHFLLHKNSVVKAVRERVYRTEDSFDEQSATGNYKKKVRKSKKPPVILNTKLSKNGTIPNDANKTYESCELLIHSPEEDGKFTFNDSIKGILKRKKLVNIKPLPDHLLKQLQWSRFDQTTGKPHVMIGCTLIKPMKQARDFEIDFFFFEIGFHLCSPPTVPFSIDFYFQIFDCRLNPMK